MPARRSRTFARGLAAAALRLGLALPLLAPTCAQENASAKPANLPPEVKMSDPQMATYAKFTATQGAAGIAPVENASLRIGDFRFYLIERGAGNPDRMAAARADGSIVRFDQPAGWYALLTAGPAEEVAPRVAFLDRIANIADPTWTYRDPRVAKLVEKPKLETAPDKSVTFTMWVVTPPAMSDPFRLVIQASPTGGATFTQTYWEELAK